MLRGKKVFFSSLVLMGLSPFLMAANPAEAQAVSSGLVAGADNIAPGPVEEVSVEAELLPPLSPSQTEATASPNANETQLRFIVEAKPRP